MPYLSIAIKAAVSILVAFVSWTKDLTRFQRWIIRGIATLLFVGALVDIREERQRTADTEKASATQTGMAKDLAALKAASDKQDIEKKRRQEISERLSSFVTQGTRLRDSASCQGTVPSSEEVRWLRDVEAYLLSISAPDAREFLHSSAILPNQICFPRIGAHVYVLERIKDHYN